MSTLAALFLITLSGPGPAPDLCPLIADLNRRIAIQTGYAPPPCPRVSFSDRLADGGLRSQAGAYFPDTGDIALAPDLDLTTAYGQSYLLHELVHAAQYASGAQTRAACPAALEAEAYRLQADFLREANLPRDAIMLTLLGLHLGGCSPTEY